MNDKSLWIKIINAISTVYWLGVVPLVLTFTCVVFGFFHDKIQETVRPLWMDVGDYALGLTFSLAPLMIVIAIIVHFHLKLKEKIRLSPVPQKKDDRPLWVRTVETILFTFFSIWYPLMIGFTFFTVYFSWDEISKDNQPLLVDISDFLFSATISLTPLMMTLAVIFFIKHKRKQSTDG